MTTLKLNTELKVEEVQLLLDILEDKIDLEYFSRGRTVRSEAIIALKQSILSGLVLHAPSGPPTGLPTGIYQEGLFLKNPKTTSIK